MGLVAPLSVPLLRATLSHAHTALLCNRPCAEASLINGEPSTAWNRHFSHSDTRPSTSLKTSLSVKGQALRLAVTVLVRLPPVALQLCGEGTILLCSMSVPTHMLSSPERKSQLWFSNFILFLKVSVYEGFISMYVMSVYHRCV